MINILQKSYRVVKSISILSIIIIINAIMSSCINKRNSDNHFDHISCADSINENNSIRDSYKRPNIGDHRGQDTIVGNFTGQGLDSIWIIERVDTIEDGFIEYNYHTKSNNSLLPSIELYGRSSHCAFIINEGDLDGDGRDEWAWMRGNFRSCADITYHLLHFDDNKWREFSIDLDGDTRTSGIDIVRKAPEAGAIIISFLYWPEMESSDKVTDKVIGYDTIFNPFQNEPMLSGYDNN